MSGEFESNQLVIKTISLPGSLPLLMHAAKGLKTSFVLDAHRVHPVQNIIMYYSYITAKANSILGLIKRSCRDVNDVTTLTTLYSVVL